MKTSRVLATVVGAAAVISLAASCGDNSAVCGEGTVEVDGICVPDDLVDCGPGTVDMGGECVPDGSVICEQGTVFDEESGTCVVDPSACAEGTVLIEGQCVPEDEALTADHEEIAEPNDGILASDDIAGQFALPATGESVVIHGCINPYRDLDDNGNPDPDLDLWIVTTTGPALVDVTADGVGGLAAGYQVISAVDEPVIDDNFVRFGINLTGDTSSRQMYLPAAGVYGIFMADSRSLFLQDGAAGSPEACYYTTVTNVAIPAATPVTVNTDVAGTHDGDVDFYSADPADGSFFIGVHDMQAAAAFGSFWVLKNDVVFEYGEPAPPNPGTVFTGGLANADEVTYVIDPIYNYALDPVDYLLRVNAPNSGPIPTGGASIVVPNVDDDFDFFGWFDITNANQMHHFEINSDEPVILWFVDEHGFILSAQESDFFDWVKFPATGRYHVLIDSSDPAADVPQMNVDSEIISQDITPLTPGTLIDDAAFSDLGATWHSFDPSSSVWLQFMADATNWGSDVSLDFLPLSGVGVPADPDQANEYDFAQFFYMDLASDGTSGVNKIVEGDPQYLIRVYDYYDEIADSTSTYDLDVGDRDYTDLGTVTESAPIDETGLTLEPGESRFFLVHNQAGDRVTLTFTPTDFDASIQFLNAFEGDSGTAVNAGGVGAAETTVRVVGTPWVAFRVDNLSGTGNTFDIDVTTESLVPYTITAGALAYQDACSAPGAQDITPPDNDEDTVAGTMPFAFDLFGDPSGDDYEVSTNGFISFVPTGNSDFSNNAIPDAADPDGVVAAYWDDLDEVTICRAQSGSAVTIQWEGIRWLTTTIVQFQAVLHSSGRIDFIYGPDHQADGASGTVGVENLEAYFGHQIVFNQAGTVLPNRSFTLVPTP